MKKHLEYKKVLNIFWKLIERQVRLLSHFFACLFQTLKLIKNFKIIVKTSVV